MAKNKEKLRRLKKQQKERMLSNKEKRTLEKQERQSTSQIFQRLEKSSLDSSDWLFEDDEKQLITFMLDHLNNYDILFMEYKLIEAIQGLILCCEQLYSEDLRNDQEWNSSAVLTVTGHYKKSPGFIRQIENYEISSERKLFLYIECLKRESEKGLIAEIIEYLCRQLQDSFVRDCSIFILSWAEMMFFLTTEHLYDDSAKRKMFLNIAEKSKNLFTDWKLYNEVLYGLPQMPFARSEEMEFPVNLTDGLPLYSEKVNCLFLRSSDEIHPFMYLSDELPEQIPQSDYDDWMDVFIDGILSNDILYIPNMEEYLIKMTTAMLASEDWDKELLLILLHRIRMFLDRLWLTGDLFMLRGFISPYPNLLLISDQPAVYRAGTGNLLAIIDARDGIVLLRSQRMEKSHIAGFYSFPGMTVQNVLKDYGTKESREIFINWESYPEEGFPDNLYYSGWALYEMTLDASTREKRRAGWIRLNASDPISVKNVHPIRDRIIEANLFRFTEISDSAGAKEYVCTAAPRTPFEADMKKGIEAYRSRRYTYATKEFLSLLDRYPDEGMLYYYIANSISYMQNDDSLKYNGMEYSLRFFQKALTLVDYVEVWVDYGNILRVMRRTEEAITVLEEARARFCDEGSPAMILASTYPDAARREAMRSEAIRKGGIRFNEILREWESEHQLLKERTTDFI